MTSYRWNHWFSLEQKAKKVAGVEAVPEAIADAKANALANGMGTLLFMWEI